ncbi:MAG: prepilin-type N-terminal cleavage/methylation domain-containing protein [Verrucomicrobiota bacterium]
MKFPNSHQNTYRGLTLIEILVVVAIIGILMAILVPSLGKGKQLAEAMKNTANLRNIAAATLSWASDNGNRLPSPQYPGGMLEDEEDFPKYWDLSDTGLWLDGVVFGYMYLAEQDNREEDEEEEGGGGEGSGGGSNTGGFQVDEDGTHLRGTVFENTMSVKKTPEERNFHRHSYAMNKDLQYDRKYETFDSPDPSLTEKTLSNLHFMPNAMLYIENRDSNVVEFEDREMILDTMRERWGNTKVIAAFLDGHAERLRDHQIPVADPLTDRLSSRFWRGVDVSRTGGGNN